MSKFMNTTQILSALRAAVSPLVKKADITIVTSTLHAGQWSEGVYSFESTYPATTYDIFIAPDGSSITQNQLSAWENAKVAGQSSVNAIKALGTVPTRNIPVIIRAVKKA